jgi:tetratricopeptide (TPR) repeat protein
MRHWITLLFCALLGGCASAPTVPVPLTLLHDRLFESPSQPVDVQEVFELSDEMRHFIDTELIHKVRQSHGSQRALIETLYRQRRLKLEYDTAQTRNAAEAFAARSGNCLSLVIMTAAIAKEMGLTVHYQSAFVEETWTRSGDLYFVNGHVNLALGRRVVDSRTGYDSNQYVVIDFLPASDIRGLRTREISEATVLSMYMNNRAAEALARGRVNDAYWLAREAVRQDPAFRPAYNTLGVIYLQGGHAQQADAVFAHVLARDPANVAALSNQAVALRSLGREEEARVIGERLARLEPHPPFHFFKLGMAAMQTGDYRAARDWFTKEVDRAGYYHEFQFWLGVAHLRLGETAAAREHLQLALEQSTTRGDRDLYAAKLAQLKPRRVQ